MSTYAQDERRARRWSLLVTLLLMGLLLVMAPLWVLFRGTIPPEGENPYIVVGRFDFGAGPGLQAGGSAPKEGEGLTPKQGGPAPIITTPSPSPIRTKPQPKSTSPASSAFEASEEEEDIGSLFGNGDASSEGDLAGGMFEFGEGEEGLQNRKLLYYVLPRYNVQKEARVKFELFVEPDGRVSRVGALTLGAPQELKLAGQEAIQQWRFSPISTGKVQRLTVTIRFKLR